MGWQSLGPGFGGYPQALAVAPAHPDRVYCGIDVGGLYRSDDGGLSWNEIYAPLRQESLNAQCPIAIGVSHQDPDRFYFITKYDGIWRSVDGGASYSRVGQIRQTGEYHHGHYVLVNQINDRMAMFFAGDKWWGTADGGDILSPIDLPLAVAPPVASAAYVNPDGVSVTLFAGSGDGSLFRFGALGWRQCLMQGFPPGGFMATEHVGRPVHTSIDWQTTQPVLLALSKATGKTYRSDNLGDNWALVPNSPAVTNSTLWVSPWDARRMAVNQFTPVPTLGFMTDSGGQMGWTPRIQLGSQSRRADQAGDEMHGYLYTPYEDLVYGWDGYSLYNSDDGGHVFFCISQERLGVQHYQSAGCESTFVNQVFVDGGFIYLSDQDQGILRSDDDGASWHCTRYAVKESIASDHPTMRGKSIWNSDSVGGMLAEPGSLLAWICGRTIMQSELETFSYIWAKDVDPSQKERHAVYRSIDGEVFEYWGKYSQFPYQWNALGGNMIRSPSGAIFVCCPAGVWKSTDDGRNWSSLNTAIGRALGVTLPVYTSRTAWSNLRSLFGHVRHDGAGTLYLSTIRRKDVSGLFWPPLLRSIDEGRTWTQVDVPIFSCWALECHPSDPCVLYLADRDEGLVVSRDAGENWEPLFDLQRITSIALAGDNVYVANDAMYESNPRAGVFASHDGGLTWDDITGDLPHLRIMTLSIAGNRLYCGTRGGGAFRLALLP